MIINVKVSDSEKSLRQEFVYLGENLRMSPNCELLKNYVEEVTKQFQGTPEDVLITVKYDW